MSNLINQHWIGLDGEPVTGRTPPRIDVLSGVMTQPIFNEVAHVYQVFCLNKQASVAAYFVTNRELSDGTRVRITSINGVDTVMVWVPPVGHDKEKHIGGFIARPTSKVLGKLTTPTYWGKPFTPELEPLGTPNGTYPFVLLRPNWVKQGSTMVPTTVYKYTRGLDEVHGHIDWQGPDPSINVLSWDVWGWDYIVFDATRPTAYWSGRWQERGSTSPTSPYDPTRETGFVQRYKCMGKGKKIYRGGKVLRMVTSVGDVDGAAMMGKTLIWVMRVGSGMNGGCDFKFMVLANGVETVIGTYSAPANTVNIQCWYFNKSGTKARCVFAGAAAQYAVEAVYSAGAPGSPGSFSFAEVAGSRGSSPTDRLITVDATLTTTTSDVIDSVPGVHYLRDTTISTVGGVGAVSGILKAYSPAIAADFMGDKPTMVRLCEVAAPPTSVGSQVTTTTTRNYYTDHWDNRTETSVSVSHTLTPPLVMQSLVFTVDGFDTEVALGEAGLQYQSVTATGSANRLTTSPPSADSGSMSYAESYTALVGAGARRALAPLDLDARTGFCLYASNVFSTVQSGQTSYAGPWSPSAGNYVCDRTGSVTQAKSDYIATTHASIDASSVLKSYGTGATSTMTPVSGVGMGGPSIPNVQGDLLVDGNPYVRRHRRWDIGVRSLASWRQLAWNAYAMPDTSGVLRTYYGNAISTTVCQSGGAYDSYPDADLSGNASAIHVIGAGGAEVYKINNQPIPWLFKLGVV